MRLVDLVIQVLKETIRNDDRNFNVENYLEGKLDSDPSYETEFNNVLLSINKAISRFVTAEKLPFKHIILVGEKDRETYDLSDYKDIKNIKSVFIIKNERTYFIGWQNFGAASLYLGYGLDTNIHIIYSPKVPNFKVSDIYTETYENDKEIRIPNNDDLDEKYGISDEMCNYISYFAKSELFEDRDPDRCKRYLNYFEQYLSELIVDRTYPHQDSVRPAYKIGR